MDSIVSIAVTAILIPIFAYLFKKVISDMDKSKEQLTKRIYNLDKDLYKLRESLQKEFEVIKLDLEARASAIEKILIKIDYETQAIIKNSATKEEFLMSLSKMSNELKTDLDLLKGKTDMIARFSHDDFGFQSMFLTTMERHTNMILSMEKKTKTLYLVIKKLHEKLNINM